MKKMVLLVALSSLLACARNDSSVQTLLVGTWQLTNYCKASGTSCTMTEIPTDKAVHITFSADGTYRETYSNTRYEGYGFVGCPGTYVHEGDGIRVFSVCSSSSLGQLIQIRSISRNQLRMATSQVGDYVLIR